MEKNKSKNNIEKIQTSTYCVAYLDFLGAKNLMKKNDDKFLNDLNAIYFEAINEIDLTNEINQKDIYTKIFSDNILLAIEIEKNDKNENAKIEKIAQLTGYLYDRALSYGYLLRGAITKGKFYKDNNDIFVYGKALIDAVEIEENLAIYPRIVIDKSIQNYVQNCLKKCSDGCFALQNFLFYGAEHIFKDKLIEMYGKFYKDEKIKQKIMWVINNFNEFYGIRENSRPIQITEEDLTNATK